MLIHTHDILSFSPDHSLVDCFRLLPLLWNNCSKNVPSVLHIQQPNSQKEKSKISTIDIVL